MGGWRNTAVLTLAVVAIAVPLIALGGVHFWGEWIATQHSGAMWQLPGAWGFHAYDVVNSLLLLATLVFVIHSIKVAEASLSKSHQAYVESLVDSRYDAMDRLYFDLLKARREKPYEQGDKSDPYPLMVWNFIETIVDKCEEDPSSKLMKTWAPLISAEARTYGAYVTETDGNDKPINSAYFKNEFMLFGRALVPASDAALAKGDDLNGVVFLRLFRSLERINDVARGKREDARLKAKLNKRKFEGFEKDKDFLACFARLHSEEPLRKLAEDRWEFSDDDPVKNNEERRAKHFEKKYAELVEAMLAHL